MDKDDINMQICRRLLLLARLDEELDLHAMAPKILFVETRSKTFNGLFPVHNCPALGIYCFSHKPQLFRSRHLRLMTGLFFSALIRQNFEALFEDRAHIIPREWPQNIVFVNSLLL